MDSLIGVSSTHTHTHTHTHRASWFTSTVQQPSASCCFHCCGHYLFICCLRMPALPHHPASSSPRSFLTKTWEEGTLLKQGPVLPPTSPKNTHTTKLGCISTLSLMNLHVWVGVTPGLGWSCVLKRGHVPQICPAVVEVLRSLTKRKILGFKLTCCIRNAHK